MKVYKNYIGIDIGKFSFVVGSLDAKKTYEPATDSIIVWTRTEG